MTIHHWVVPGRCDVYVAIVSSIEATVVSLELCLQLYAGNVRMLYTCTYFKQECPSRRSLGPVCQHFSGLAAVVQVAQAVAPRGDRFPPQGQAPTLMLSIQNPCCAGFAGGCNLWLALCCLLHISAAVVVLVEGRRTDMCRYVLPSCCPGRDDIK